MSAKNRSPLMALWDFFCSLKLTIFTLIMLATTSIIGTVIQQNRPTQEYVRVYGKTAAEIIQTLDFSNMYHSRWFMGLLALFAVNLVACSIKRFPRVWKTVKNPTLAPEDNFYRTFSNFEEVVSKETPAEVKKKLEAFLARRFAKPVVTEKEGKIHLFSQKGAYARFSVYITHLSILIIFVGAIIGSVWGFKGYVQINEGQQASQVWPLNNPNPTHAIPLGFSVRCNSFSVSFYPGTGRPKEFKSVLTVLDNGKPVPGLDHHTIIVNKPLTYKGITFYQSGYGPLYRLDLQAKDRSTGKTAQLTLRKGEQGFLPGGGYVRVVDFIPDYTRSFHDFGAIAKLEVVPASGSPRLAVVPQNFPNYDARQRPDSAYIFKLTDSKQEGYFTGLQVAKDPGVWVVWLGCILLVSGTICAFYLSHRRIWVTIQPAGEKTGVKVGGSAHRNQPSFALFFDEFKKALKTEITS